MGSKTANYLRAMQAVDDFFEMLFTTLRAAMPGAEFSTTGCMWWRGYKINQYKTLTKGGYYFQIYADTPYELVFEEAWKDPGYKPNNSKDLELRIIRGRCFYPFVLKLNLCEIRFFDMGVEAQMQSLGNFIDFCIGQALLWQKSADRSRKSKPEFLAIQEQSSYYTGLFQPEKSVHVDYLDAFPLQNALLDDLKNAITTHAPAVYEQGVDWLRANKDWRNWGWRGWRLKLKDLSAGGHADYFWQVFYDQPDQIMSYRYNGRSRRKIGVFDAAGCAYFDLSKDGQEAELRAFVEGMLSASIGTHSENQFELF